MPENITPSQALLYKTLHPTQRRFLSSFEVCGSLTKAARWAKIHRSNHYAWMDDEEYAAAFRIAESRATRTLEDEAVRRAHEGIRKPVRYKGKIVGYDTEFDNTLLLALLKAGNPEKFRDRSTNDVNLKGTLTIPLSDVDKIIREAKSEPEKVKP
jgi:hypothetical protein